MTWSNILASGAFCLISLACSAFCFIKNLVCGAFFSYFFAWTAMHLISSFLFCLPIHWWWKWFELSILSDHDDTICTKQYLRKCQLTTPLPVSNQTWQPLCQCQIKHHFDSKTVCKKQCTAGEMPHPKHTDFEPSTQITLIERTRQSAWLDAMMTPLTRSEWILVYKTRLFLEGSPTKQITKTPGNALAGALLM